MTQTQIRVHPRISVSGPLVDNLLIEGTNEALDCRPFEVSNGGLGIWTSVPLKPGMHLRLQASNDDGTCQDDVRLRVKYCLKNHLNTQLFRCGLVSVDSKIDFFGDRKGLKIVAEKNNTLISANGDIQDHRTRPTKYISRTEAALHDARNYLLVIQCAAELLQHESGAGAAKLPAPQLAQRILKAVGQLTHCVDDIHADQNSFQIEQWHPVVAQELLQDAADMCRGLLEQNGIEIQITAPPERIKVFGQPKALLRVLLNLLINAKDAINKSAIKWIRLDVSEAQGLVRIKVSDSGHLPKENRSKVFAPYYSTKEPGGGHSSGVGLAFAKNVLEHHGGTIYVDEEAPETIFVIEIQSESKESNEKVWQ